MQRSSHSVILVAVLLLCGGGLSTRAYAQNLPLPQALTLDQVAQILTDVGARVPTAAVVDAYESYLNEFEAAFAAADAEFAQLPGAATPNPPAAGNRSRGAPTLEADTDRAKRLRDLDTRSLATTTQLVSALADRLQAAAPGQDERMATVRALLGFRNAYGHISGGATGQFSPIAPFDLPSILLSDASQLSDDEYSAARESLLQVQTANLPGRAAALSGFIIDCRDARIQGLGIVAVIETPAFVGFAREQLKSYDQALPALTARQRAQLSRRWLPSLAGEAFSPAMRRLPSHPSVSTGGPADYMRMLLQIEGLSNATKQALRDIGKSWVSDDAAIIRSAVESATPGALQACTKARTARVAKAIEQISVELHAPEMIGPRPAMPDVKLTASLAPEDEDAFGGERPAPEPTESLERLRARSHQRPVGYTREMAALLAADLRLTDSQRQVVDTILVDAAERWAKEVQPIVAQSFAPPFFGGTQTPEMRMELRRLDAMGADAFSKAFECDAALFASLDAALPASVNRDALKLAAAARRTSEGTGAGTRDRMELRAIPVDVPRIVLESPLSEAGRRAALAEAAPFSVQWDSLGRQRQVSERAMNLGSSTAWFHDGAPDALDDGNSESELADRRAVAEKEAARVAAAWKAAETESIERIAGVLSPEDAEIWRSRVRRGRWPRAYPDLGDINAQMADIADAPARAKALQVLKAADPSVQLSGERVVVVMENCEASRVRDPRDIFAVRAAYLRPKILTSLAPSRVAIVAERVRAQLPPDLAAKIPQSVAMRRLAAAGAAPASATPDAGAPRIK